MMPSSASSGGRAVTHEAHWRELLEGSGISRDVVVEAGLWSESDPRELAKMTGLSAKLWSPERLPALVLPYPEVGGVDPSLFRIKPLTPLAFDRADGTTELRKYVQPKGEGVRLYFPPRLCKSERDRRDVSLSLVVTEGEKKTLAAESHGLLCVGLSGVSCWSQKKGRKRVLHHDWQHVSLKGRRVFVCFDSDATTNLAGVRREEKALCKALAAAGAIPHVVRLPGGPGGEKWGLDDFLVACGAEDFKALAKAAKPAVKAPKVVAEAPAPGTATTDLGNAERLHARHGRDLRWVPAWRSWLRWDGIRWARVSDEEVTSLAIETVRAIYGEVAEAGKRGERERAEELLRHAQRSESASALANTIKVARALEGMAVEVDALDADDWLLCCPNGVLDLRTLELREHRRDDLITRCAAAEYRPEARSEAWERFVREASEGDQEMLRFLQVSAGYALTGDTSEERMWLVQGVAGSGKSTFLETLRNVLGDHAVTAEFQTFTRRERNEHGPRPDIARLAGARLVIASEGEDSQRLSEALVKNVTGGERVTARFLYGSDFEFRPRFKLWLATNHNPTVRHDDSGVWRRLLHVPFRHEVGEGKRDPRLKAELVDVARSGAAVLAWAVEGLRLWREGGIKVPASVSSSTEDFRASQDVIGEFFEDRFVAHPKAIVTAKAARVAYKEWKDEVGARHAPGVQRLYARFRDEGGVYGVSWVNGRRTRVWQGIGLRGETEYQDDDQAGDGTLHSLDSFSPETSPRVRPHGILTDNFCENSEVFRPSSEGSSDEETTPFDDALEELGAGQGSFADECGGFDDGRRF